MAYYNYRLTGNALLMPYVLHQRTYSPDRIFAPITGAPIILAMYGARWLRVRFVRFGPAVVTLFTACVLAGGLYDFRSEREQAEKPQPRQQIENTIMKQAGPHLVLLRYTPSHDPGDEFVYNAADIDRSPIVWARDMGDEGNRELLDYYPTRKVWLLQPDLTPVSLTPYARPGHPGPE